jgi:hypothetical protein
MAVTAFGQLSEKIYWTEGHRNCRAWMKISFEMRMGFIAGLQDGYTIAKDFKPGVIDMILGRDSYTVDEPAKGVTSICSIPENSNIPVFAALTAYNHKIMGSSEKVIQDYLLKWRQTGSSQ